MDLTIIDIPTGKLNIIDPIGRGVIPTNNPFSNPREPFIHDDTRTGGFGNHAIATIGSKVWDAMLRYENIPDRTPEFPLLGWQDEFNQPPPYSFVLPIGVPLATYLDRLLDDISNVAGAPTPPTTTVTIVPVTVS